MRANDITVGEHYAYTEYKYDMARLVSARKVEALEVALDTKGPHGDQTVHVRFVDGAGGVRIPYLSEAWVRPDRIACGWEEAVALRAAMQRNKEIERVAKEQARQEAASRFAMQEVRDTGWAITFDTEPRSPAVPPVVVATLDRSFFDEYQAIRVLAGLRDRFIEEAGAKARGEARRRLEDPAASASITQGQEAD